MAQIWNFSRPNFVILDGLNELSKNGSSQFYDLDIFCSDGLVRWNRFCLAMFGGIWRELLNTYATESCLNIPDISREELNSILNKFLVFKGDTDEPYNDL